MKHFNFIRDIAPVASIARVTNVMEMDSSFPAKTVPEFIAYAKANPGKISMASSGIGTVSHVAGELFKVMAGVNMLHVPYRGEAPALTDLLGGQVQVLFGTATAAIEYIKAGKLRALAVTGARSEALPDIPAMANFLPGYEASLWPTEIVEKLNREINAILSDSRMSLGLADLAAAPMPMTPAAFGKFIADETEKWAKVIQVANIKGQNCSITTTVARGQEHAPGRLTRR
jgi:tripartite-type tricarboxylate transporter receptor subunit TctC